MLKLIRYLLLGLLTLSIIAAVGILGLFYTYGHNLPDYHQLAHYEPDVVTRIYAADGRLFAEYATEKRIFVPIEAIPKHVIQTFLAAEDHNFYQHHGLDYLGIARAAISNLLNLGRKKRPAGASTITQQVAKNFLLSNEISYIRKVKEAILAFRIEHTFNKDKILELYLNQIYLGRRSYGVAAAALNYFNKSLSELTVAEAAFLAALPKAPNIYQPERYPKLAIARRNWVISRMLSEGLITPQEAKEAKASYIELHQKKETEGVKADYFAEAVRQEILKKYGENALYKEGLVVRTSLNPELQTLAERIMRESLLNYDKSHGWRGPFANISLEDWRQKLEKVAKPAGLYSWDLAVVLSVGPEGAIIGIKGKTERGFIPLAELKWARKHLRSQDPAKPSGLGPEIRQVPDVLKVGDIIAVESLKATRGEYALYSLRQVPDIGGGLVALDPHTGRILALVGGYSFETSQFDRVTQALRQPGSAFKTFIYLSAFENGFTPASTILDEPLAIELGYGLGVWKPKNVDSTFHGRVTLRRALEKSYNIPTIRLAQEVGMTKISTLVERLGLMKNLPSQLAMALGAGETTLLKLTAAYAMIVNGGHYITPTFIDRVQDRHGKTVFKQDTRFCEGCQSTWIGQEPPALPDIRLLVIDPAHAYQIVSILENAIKKGTGRKSAVEGQTIAGKTGTTNNAMDTWFVGFTPDLIVGVFVGYDVPRNLGANAYGGTLAAPIFQSFMKEALKGKPSVPFRIPAGVKLVRINEATGELATTGDFQVILEAFKSGTEPTAPYAEPEKSPPTDSLFDGSLLGLY